MDFCTIIMGVLVIVLAWWKVGWAAIVLTVIGALLIIHGFMNKCRCGEYIRRRRGSGPGPC